MDYLTQKMASLSLKEETINDLFMWFFKQQPNIIANLVRLYHDDNNYKGIARFTKKYDGDFHRLVSNYNKLADKRFHITHKKIFDYSNIYECYLLSITVLSYDTDMGTTTTTTIVHMDVS